MMCFLDLYDFVLTLGNYHEFHHICVFVSTAISYDIILVNHAVSISNFNQSVCNMCKFLWFTYYFHSSLSNL